MSQKNQNEKIVKNEKPAQKLSNESMKEKKGGDFSIPGKKKPKKS